MSCVYTNYTATPPANISIPCNDVVGSQNLFGGGVAFTDYGYLLNAPSTDAGEAGTGQLALPSGILIKGSFVVCLLTTKLVRICCLIIAPTFFSAANYILLGSLIRSSGGQYSTLTSRSFSNFFTFFDIICLLIQAGGGGIVGGASTTSGMKTGLHVMAVGVILQLCLTVVFLVFFTEYCYRSTRQLAVKRQFDLLAPLSRLFRRGRANHRGLPSASATTQPGEVELKSIPNLAHQATVPSSGDRRQVSPIINKLMMGTMTFGTLLIIIRSIYRCDELLDFSSANHGAYANQNLFIGMDASLMLLFVVVYLAFHPGLVDGKKIF
ncbi:RTA1 like protein-domain-containing protein [Naematelia encephala]|uniref:RTA1 like protein-domain-containing protein n=1 Tax=Naematelia encephala TaxID=71784 RepID=A0A1Y2AG18_9TREE|nr:RTA1 like protein-domain-containing protein [Naematelia encephala]